MLAKGNDVRRCRHCRTEIPPKAKSDHWQRAGFCCCDHMAAHGLQKAQEQRKRKADREAKEKRKRLRERKEALKTRSEHMREAQAAFNAYIRARDAGLPCVSCGRNDGEVMAQAVGGTWDCGHYRSVGASPELRFEPLNAHRQCKRCNRDLSGNIVPFRMELRRRIGDDLLNWLEGNHPPKKYTIEDLEEIKRKYRRMARELKRD